ncbi:G-patch domain and KOW motifs-containing protein-like [Anneissia japonica]|uniref:G-patch domain and KOW motifs-containing protein-like n=1 Tax=Anneissia japonica TaxID=1529436 RepID=UPI001425975E|nr:G-patch domain and KOW motifs-containing protein-like [Anneissia japonica]
MSSDSKKPLSFGFSKKKETKVLGNRKNLAVLGGEKLDKTTASASEETASKPDLITSLEGKKVISLVPKKEPEELVIPLLKRNTWSIESKTGKQQRISSGTLKSPGSEGLDLDNVAVQEIISETTKQNMDWEDRGNEDMGMSIPLLMRNKVPEGYETEDKLDVSIRPNEATDADYDQVPISQFGMAMLRGMGLKDGEEAVKPIEPKLRPKGQGLGAAPRPPEFSTKPKRPLKPGEKRQEDTPIGYAKGVGVMATKGPHKNMYGRIEGVDEDNAQLVIKLAIGGQSVTISQYIANIVDDDEYRKYAKDLSRLSKSKDNQEQQSKEGKNDKHSRGRIEGEEESSEKKEYKRDKERDKHDQKRKKHKGKQTEEKYREKSDQRQYDEDEGSKYRREGPDKDRHENKRMEGNKSCNKHWLQPDLRVRFIDRVYKNGKYYMSKVNIEDVVTLEQCTCKTDDGCLLYDVSESMLETVIPKAEPGYVMIVLGKHKGQLGIVVKKHKDRQRADVQLLQDRNTIIRQNYEEICQYAGDIHSNEDY